MSDTHAPHPLWQTIAGPTLTPERSAALHAYLDLLLERNALLNLTAIRDRDAAEVRHVADALLLLEHLPDGPIDVLDFGSGGGVPGVPLAIMRPDARVTLLDATAKKVAFLQDVVDTLGLSNATAIHGRGEILPKHAYDVVVARAVAPLRKLAGWCLPRLKPGGVLLAMKGKRAADELAESKLRGTLHHHDIPELAETVVVRVPGK